MGTALLTHQGRAKRNAPIVDKPVIQYAVEEAREAGSRNSSVTGRGST
jgi:UTP-glucose-1-phosphate uridylyltransferase